MTCPASSIFGIDSATIMPPVDKGGLGPRPPRPARYSLQRVCYGLAAAFLAAGLAFAVAVDIAVLIPFVVPVTLFFIGGLALGLPHPSQRQHVTLLCVLVTLLVTTGISMMPHELGPVMEAVRDFGFMVCTAATVLAGICAFLPPYGRDAAGKGDKMLRAAAPVFCLFATFVSYFAVIFVCTPHMH